MTAWFLVAAGAALLCLGSSLFGRLGFAFGFVMAPLCALAGLHFGVRAGQLAGPIAPTWRAFGRGLLSTAIVLAAPLGVMAASAPWSPSCGVASGLRWYAMMPGASALFGLAIGFGLGQLAVPRVLALALALPVVSAVIGLVYGYLQLPVFAYDPFWGYFPGSLYDEQVSLRPAFYWARLYHAAIAVCFLAALAARRRRRWLALAVVSGTGAITLSSLAPQLGFRQSTQSVIAGLGGKHTTAHFTLYFRAGTDPVVVEQLAEECEFRYARLVELIGAGPPHIDMFFFDSVGHKQQFTGLQGTSIARPWLHQIVTHGLAVPHDVINHELVHVFFASFGDRWFGLPWRGLRLASGLVEGVAVGLDDDDSDDEVHGLAQTMRKDHVLPPLGELMSLRFLLHPPVRAYTAAGSFCRFLVSRFGGRVLPPIYAAGGDDAALVASVGQPLAALEQAWWEFLAARPMPKLPAEAKEALQRPSLFARRCPHELATRRALAFAAMQTDVDRGLAMLDELCREDAGRPEHVALLLKEAINRRRAPLAEAAAWRLFAHPSVGERGLAQASEALGDFAMARGDRATAFGYFSLAESLPAEPPIGRLRRVKREMAALPAGPLAETMVKYLYEDRDKPARAAELVNLAPDVGLYQYLFARQRSGAADIASRQAALLAFDRAIALGLPDERFVKEALVVGIETAVSIGKYDAAARLAVRLHATGDPSAPVWQRRVAFLRQFDKTAAAP